MTANRVDFAVLGIGVVAVSTAAVLIREADAPTLVIAVYRLGLASLPLLLISAATGRAARPTSRRWAALTLLAGAFLALHIGFWIASLKATSVVTSVVLVTSQPLLVAVASGPLLGERPAAAVWLGIAVAAVGALVMVGDDLGAGTDTLLGDLYALLGAVFAACYILAGRGLRGGGWLPYVTLVYTTAALILLAAVGVAGEPLTAFSGATYVYFVLIALVPQLVGHSAINRSLGYLPAATVAVAILGEPVGATALAALVLHETPTALEAVGGVLVLAGVYVGLRPTLRRIHVVATD